jgi:hypothetical protein
MWEYMHARYSLRYSHMLHPKPITIDKEGNLTEKRPAETKTEKVILTLDPPVDFQTLKQQTAADRAAGRDAEGLQNDEGANEGDGGV